MLVTRVEFDLFFSVSNSFQNELNSPFSFAEFRPCPQCHNEQAMALTKNSALYPKEYNEQEHDDGD